MVTGVGAANVPPPQKFQSLFGMVDPSVTMPVIVSCRCVVSVAPALFVGSTGKYGIGLPITFSGCAPRPLRLMMRPTMCPVTPVSTGTFTQSLLLGVTGASVDAFAGTIVAGAVTGFAPALSPCQPLLKPTSLRLRRSGVMVIRPPRFGTSCHISPLARDMSTGLTMKKLATYPTLPLTRGARSMSVMSVLSGSLGSSSPNARPVSLS